MKNGISDKTKPIFVFLLLLVIALVADITAEQELENGYIYRSQTGEKGVKLEIEVDGLLEDYAYELEVTPILPTKEEAEAYFEETIACIEKEFASLEESVPVRTEYLEGAVEADWSFTPFGVIDTDGTICADSFEEDEVIVDAKVQLRSGNYEQIYTFSFVLEKPVVSEEEQLIKEIQKELEEQMTIEGSQEIKLPTEIDGKVISWKEKREYITPQILLLEIIAVALLVLLVRRRRQDEERKRLEQMAQRYPDIVSQLSLLLGAGMTARQAWARLAGLYQWKRKMNLMEPDVVYEAILRINHRLMEGESERDVYQKFVEEIPANCFHKLIRILLGGLEKGAQGIAAQLQDESRCAFEQRILIAKKKGEEASTRMLVPLMLMMLIVMAMVMLPALLEFQI